MTFKSIPTLEKVLRGCSILYIYLDFYYRIFLAEKNFDLNCFITVKFFQNGRAIMKWNSDSAEFHIWDNSKIKTPLKTLILSRFWRTFTLVQYSNLLDAMKEKYFPSWAILACFFVVLFQNHHASLRPCILPQKQVISKLTHTGKAKAKFTEPKPTARAEIKKNLVTTTPLQWHFWVAAEKGDLAQK